MTSTRCRHIPELIRLANGKDGFERARVTRKLAVPGDGVVCSCLILCTYYVTIRSRSWVSSYDERKTS